MQGALLLLFMLLIVIFVHELGHLIAFRRLGIAIDTMAIGIPWGPRILIRSVLLRRYFGPNFMLILSPLVFGGYVAPQKPELIEQLRDNEKALAYGGGVIANILLYLFICMVVLVMSFVNGAPSTPRGIDPLVYATLLVLVCIVLTCYARFVCRYIFPIIGMVILVWFGLVLWKVFGNIALLEGVGFAGIAAGAESARAADVAVTGGNGGGHLLSYLGMLSLLVGLTNLLPLIPLDGGHLMMIHVEKWAPKCKSYFVRLGIALAVFLLLFQFVPDLYNVFT